MAIINKLTDIADAIRSKTGENGLMTLAQMPAKIMSISGGGSGNLFVSSATGAVMLTDLCFTANTANSTIQLAKRRTPYDITLEISTDGVTWTAYTIGNTITLANVGDKVYFRGDNEYFSKDYKNYYNFVMDGSISASGSIMSLLGDNPLTDYCFYMLFTVCTSLTTAPELPATTLTESCYSHMFDYCTSLTTAPELPATILAGWCYAYMFADCTSLTTAPELAATTLADKCYASMFDGCTSLNYIKIAYTGNFDTTVFSVWVGGVSATGDFYYNGSDTTRGVSAIPSGWTVHTY